MTYRKSRIWLLIALLLVSLLILLFEWPFFILLLPVLGYIGLLVYGAMFIQANFFIRSVNELSPGIVNGKPVICLSFDDGIHPVHTANVLDILEKEDVKAMFFLVGKHLPGNEDLLRRMAAEGHVIGNHSDGHSFWFDLQSKAAMTRDLLDMNERVIHILGESHVPAFFRPPYGVTNPNLAAAITTTGMKSIGWNLRSMDTVARSPETLLAKLKSETRPGCIVLLHDRCAMTVDVLTDYITFCKQQGYIFTTPL